MPPLSATPPTKTVWRTLMRKERAALAADAPRHAALSFALQQNVLQSPLWRDSEHVLLYHAVKGEAGTALLLAEARRQGKQAYLPRCRPDMPGGMDLLACPENPDDLIVSPMGIPEPPASCRALPENTLAEALIVVPALAFDRQGYRLGYGGGYYDRLLAGGKHRSLGMVFCAHLVDKLPRDPWDMPVTALATEEGVLWL